MSKLQSLLNRLDAFDAPLPVNELVALMSAIVITRDDLAYAISFSDAGYKRNVLRAGSGYAALALCWKAGQTSPIHDHRGSACGVRVISGEATETRYDRSPDGRLSVRDVRVHRAGNVCGSYDADIHTIGNEQMNGRELITLHVYTPPMLSYHLYSMNSPAVQEYADAETVEALQQRGLTVGA